MYKDGFGPGIPVKGKRRRDDLDLSQDDDEIFEDNDFKNKTNFLNQNEEDIIEFHLNNLQKE